MSLPLRLLPHAALVTALAVPALAQTSPFTQPTDPVTQAAPQMQRQAQRNASGASSINEERVQQFGSVALSPDGQWVAWTLRAKAATAIHLSPATGAGGAEQQITIAGQTGCEYGNPIWSPDGQTLAFTAACAAASADPTVPRQAQIYLWPRSGGPARQLTHVTGDLNQPAWSPDGKAIGFLFVENATRTAGALDAMKPWAGVIGEDGVEVQGIYIVGTADGHGRMFTSPAQHVYEFTWSPKSDGMAWIAAAPPGENNWWVAKLYQQQFASSLECVETKVCRTDVGPPSAVLTAVDPAGISGPLHGLQIAVPRFSPDGTRISFIGGLMSDQGSTGGDVYVVNVSRLGFGDDPHAQPVDVTPNIDGSPCYEAWVNDRTLAFVEDRRGHTLIRHWNVDTKSGDPRSIDLGEVTVGGGPIKDAVSITSANGGTLAFSEQGFAQAPEVWTLGAHGPHQLTHLNADAKPVARTESVEWINGPYHVQGWLTYPANYNAATKYPLIVTVHGGPSASVGARWGGGTWAEKGYFEFQPNPRGSFGQGEAFTEANRKDFGDGDLKDILAGLDMLEAKYPIDKNREGITGWSYGGFMTMFSVTQTHRFRAAVAGAGLADWLSYYGENSIDQWMIPFFGASVYDDPAVYAKSSPITFIKNVKTPTLVIVGDRDGECPAPQSFEFWHALRDLGVKTQLVVYPDEGHGFRDPEHIKDRAARTAKWFADNMPPEGQATASVTPETAVR